MRPLAEILRRTSQLHLRGPTIPAVCYDTCNNANIEAQSIGKSAALCDPGSVFLQYYQACISCIEKESDDEQAVDKDYLDTQFGGYLSYCDQVTTESQPFTRTTALSLQSSTTSLKSHTVIITTSLTVEVEGVKTVVPFTKTIPVFDPIPETKVITTTRPVDGHLSIWIYTTTFDPLLRDTSASPPQSSESIAINPTDPIITASSQRSRAWVAGPVIGGVVGAGALILVAWLFIRAQRSRHRRRLGHELHGEAALKSELEVKHPPQELAGEELERPPPTELHGDSVQNQALQ
ncbi:putative glycoprotein X [Rosellinia necatrix]|uniref:Putative glycoprotein X n=1 Tax=Rosellinia necatrix TaxID=77044 RepID=A0A1W2TW89_ROSNE|nr:putative glycoprotein X [Rosellinia necatrix]